LLTNRIARKVVDRHSTPHVTVCNKRMALTDFQGFTAESNTARWGYRPEVLSRGIPGLAGRPLMTSNVWHALSERDGHFSHLQRRVGSGLPKLFPAPSLLGKSGSEHCPNIFDRRPYVATPRAGAATNRGMVRHPLLLEQEDGDGGQ
jgi:hypothetical protein